MTNYQWMTEHDYMPTFFRLLKEENYSEIAKRYDVPTSMLEYPADWLEMEHTFPKYIKVDEAVDIVKKTLKECVKITRHYDDVNIDEIIELVRTRLELSEKVIEQDDALAWYEHEDDEEEE